MMNRRLICCLFAVVAAWLLPANADGQHVPRPGIVKKVDSDKGTVTIAHDGEDEEFKIADDTRLMDLEGRAIEQRLNDERLKADTPIFFVPLDNNPKTLRGMKIRRVSETQPGGKPPALVKVDTSAFKPLTELGGEEYHGFQGGLYPGGSNERPADHQAAGLKLAAQVRPLNAKGEPDANGKIVLLTVGMSNTHQASQALQRLAEADSQKNPQLMIVDGAQGGMTALAIQDPDDGGRGTQYWTVVDERLREAGVSPAQVQAVWIKQADAGPNQGFPKYAEKLQQELGQIVRILPQRFPNVKLCYLSPRTYGGYAKTPLNPEPYAYESGFSIKWLIEQQLRGEADFNFDPANGPVKAPWLSWGTYLWANGTKPNADGLSYDEEDFAPDGTHESPSGQRKVGRQLLNFFKTDSTTKPWFVRGV
jgi:hypothetical protein